MYINNGLYSWSRHDGEVPHFERTRWLVLILKHFFSFCIFLNTFIYFGRSSFKPNKFFISPQNSQKKYYLDNQLCVNNKCLRFNFGAIKIICLTFKILHHVLYES